MRLLLDQNLFPRLLDLLADLYPDSQHVRGLLRQHHADLVAFDQHAEGMFLALG